MGDAAEPPTTRWKTVRPWLPPRSASTVRRLELEVVDVSSTAVSLSVFSPDPASDEAEAEAQAAAAEDGEGEAESSAVSGAPAISIKLNGRPWSQVAHAGTPVADDALIDESEPLVPDDVRSTDARRRRSSSSLSRRFKNGREGATIVIYGLEPGKEYEVELDVVDGEEEEEGAEDRGSPEAEPRLSRVVTRASAHIPSTLR